MRKFARICLYGAAAVACLLAVLLLLVKLALDRVPQYQEEIKARIFRQTGLHVAFQHVSPSLRWYGPELLFDRIELRSHDDRRVLARAASGRIGADIRQFLHGGRLFAGRIELVSPDLTIVRLGPHSFALAAEIELNRPASANEALTLDDVPAGTLEIRTGRIALQDWNPQLPQLLLERVNLVLRRGADAISLDLAAQLPTVLGGTLGASGVVTGLADPATPDWNGRLQASGISFAGWRQLVPDYLGNLAAGSGEFRLAARGRGPDLAHAALDFTATAVETRIDAGATARFERIGGTVALDHAADRWTLSGRRVVAVSPGHKDPPSEFNVSWRVADAALVELQARASYLRVEGLLPLVGLLPQKELRERLIAAAPTGVWQDATLQLSRATPADPWALDVRARFTEAGVAPLGNAPGFRGLSGEIAGNATGGHVRLTGDTALMAWPAQWPQPVGFDALQGTLYWKRDPDGLLIATPALDLHNADGALHALMALRLPASGDSPQLTLVAQVDDARVPSVRYYLPRGIIGAQTLTWLDQAFIAGRLAHADVVLQGNLRQFPFRDGGGRFVARAQLEGMTLNVGEGWPLIEDMKGIAEFHNEGLTMQLQAARTLGLRLDSGDAEFADFKTGELRIHAAGSGDADEAIRFLRATPLDAQTDGAFSAVEGKGAISGNVDLFLPFRDFVHRRILVHAHLGGVTLSHPGLPFDATDLRGDLDIDGGPVARADVRGQLLGGPVRLTARAPRKRPLLRTQLDLHGAFGGDALRAALGLPAGLILRGAADWQGTMVIANAPNRERALHVSSTLAGLDSQLPAPLGKAPARAVAATLDLDWPVTGGLLMTVGLGDIAHAAFAYASGAGGDRLTHAAVLFGAGNPGFSDAQIINIGGHIDRLSLDGWQPLLAGGGATGAGGGGSGGDGKPLSYYLHDARLSVDRIDLLGVALHKVDLSLERVTDHWKVGFSGPQTEGTVTLPADDAAPLDIAFRRLRADDADDSAHEAAGAAANTAARAAAGAPAPVSPASVPALNVAIDDLAWGDRHLGNVEGKLSRVADGVTLDHLTVTSPSFTIKASGDWRGKDPGLGHLNGVLQSSDVGTTLTQLGYADILTAKSGRVDFDLNWSGVPSAEALRDSTGRLKVELERGQVLGIKPGAGRLLGLASIAELPRRLTLDFSDLTDKGLAFDTVRGDFDLRGGDAYTDDVLLKGPAAEVGLIGRVGLKSRDYDQTAKVTGNFGNSLPLAALAGGPATAAVVLLFSQVFKQPLNGLTRAYYRITGSWDNPSIERVKGAEAAASTNAEAAK